MSGTRLVGSWLLGIGIGLTVLAVIDANIGNLVASFLVGSIGLLLLTRAQGASLRFPGTDLERSLDRLFALLLPTREPTTAASARLAMAQRLRIAGLRRGARRWGNELQLITADGYATASRISAHSATPAEQDDRALVAEIVSVLGAERTTAGADPTVTSDPVSILAYGLGARPAGADLTSLEDLLRDLGLSEGGDELRTHFDDVIAAAANDSTGRLALKNLAQQSMFRDLAGASFVLGVSARILELVTLAPVRAAPAS